MALFFPRISSKLKRRQRAWDREILVPGAACGPLQGPRKLDAVLDAIDATGLGLTLGVQSA